MGRRLTRPGVNGDWDQAEGQQCSEIALGGEEG